MAGLQGTQGADDRGTGVQRNAAPGYPFLRPPVLSFLEHRVTEIGVTSRRWFFL